MWPILAENLANKINKTHIYLTYFVVRFYVHWGSRWFPWITLNGRGPRTRRVVKLIVRRVYPSKRATILFKLLFFTTPITQIMLNLLMTSLAQKQTITDYILIIDFFCFCFGGGWLVDWQYYENPYFECRFRSKQIHNLLALVFCGWCVTGLVMSCKDIYVATQHWNPFP